MAVRPLEIMQTALEQKNARIHSLEQALAIRDDILGIDERFKEVQCPHCDTTGLFKVYSSTPHVVTGEPVPTAIECAKCGEGITLCGCGKPIIDSPSDFDCAECHQVMVEENETEEEATVRCLGMTGYL